MVLLLFNFSPGAGESGKWSAPVVLAQSATASLSGMVIDERDAAIPGAGVTLLNPATGFRRETRSNSEGNFEFHFLQLGEYQATIVKDGFAAVVIENLTLNVNDSRAIRIRLKVGGINDTLIIKADGGFRDTSTVSTVIDRPFIAHLPNNGQNVLPLIALAPGVVPATASSIASGWGYSINGQRPTANYLTVDGVSANIAAGNSLSPGPAMIGALPGLTVFGGLNDLVSIDALQEFKVVTSGSPPEFGRSPGGQISLVTRSGTNEFHGALFHNFRNDALDASDWFANRNGLQKPQLRQNEFGGVLGGPLLLPRLADGALHLHNSRRLFFFFSYEGMRLRQPQVVNTELPSLSTRQRAATGLKPFLDAFPIPNGPELANPGLAEFAAAYSNPSRLDAISIRLDHTVNDSLQIFVRYNDAPSENDTRSTITPSVSERTILNTRTLTLGGTLSLRPKITADFRFNYSRTEYDDSSSLDAFGGAVPLSASQIFPSFASPADSQIAWDINFVNSTGLPNLLPTIDYSRLSGAIAVGRNARNLQRQFNLVDNLSVSAGKHQLKFGFDYRRMAPKYAPPVYLQGSVFDDAVAVETGITSIVTIEARNEAAPLLHNFSAFLQDSWRAGSRLTLVYGMRWELNPSPSANGGVLPYTAIGLDDPATMRLAPENSPLWKTTYRNFAPRLGVTYQVSQTSNHETILRAGLGLYYDLGPGFALAGYTSPPFIRSAGLVNEPFPVNPSRAMPPPPGSLQPPYGGLTVIDPELKLPYTMQWNLAVEHSLGSNQTISATYLGALGRRLLNGRAIYNPNPDFTLINAIQNNALSNYQALQIQFQRRLARGLQAQAGYSWSHSIDIGSNEDQWLLGLYKGPSDFDVRQILSAALTFDLPFPVEKGGWRRLLHGWSVDSIVRAQSALPVNVVQIDAPYPRNHAYEILRPNLVPGVPLFLKDATAPGGKRINPAAFSPSVSSGINGDSVASQGTLGRNALRGFPFSQIDLSLRRKFKLTEKVGLQFKAGVFNVINHPNFSNPEATLYLGFAGLPLIPIPNSSFGYSQSMVGRSGEGTGIIGGLNSLYQAGGPRSLQFSLKLEF